MLGICSGVCDVLVKRKPRRQRWDVQVIQNSAVQGEIKIMMTFGSFKHVRICEIIGKLAEKDYVSYSYYLLSIFDAEKFSEGLCSCSASAKQDRAQGRSSEESNS